MSKQDGTTRQVSSPTVDSSTAPILHVDLDAFFASVELLDRPQFRQLPVAVAGRSARSVVSAANYPARRYGVRSAMPLSQALRLCPKLIVLEPHYELYQQYSAQVMSILDDVSPLVERLGIDEAFVDVAGARSLIGPPATVASLIRSRVYEDTGLRCSIGAAATKFVAKLASGRAKPDGLLVVPADDTLNFLRPLPAGALWGVGGVTERTLAERGLTTVGQIAATPLPALQRIVGDALGQKLYELARGVDPRPVTPGREEKSVGHEVTFEVDITDAELLRRELLRLSTRVGARLREAQLAGGTVVLKLRYSDFTTITRSRTLPEPTNLSRRIYEEARASYDAIGAHRPVRLIGVRAEQLTEDGGGQPALWDPDADWRQAEQAVDGIAQRFGRGALGPASLVTRPPVERGAGDPA